MSLELDERVKVVHSIVRSFIKVGRCNTQASLNGKRLTYKNIIMTDDQFEGISSKLANLNCEIRKYQNMYSRLILTIRVLENS